MPVCVRGRGLGALLARAALDWAVTEGRRVTLSCSYLQKYHRENMDMDHLGVVVEEQQGTPGPHFVTLGIGPMRARSTWRAPTKTYGQVEPV